MKKPLLIALLWTSAATCLSAQRYHFAGESPFGIQVTRPDGGGLAMGLHFIDLDQDGDRDLLLYGLDGVDTVPPVKWSSVHYFLEFQENTGDAGHPAFAPRRAFLEDFPFPEGYFFAAPHDLDGDQDIDFLVNGAVDFVGNRTLLYYRKNPANDPYPFTVTRMDTQGLRPFIPASMFMPVLADFDQDGDPDLLMSGANPPFGFSGTTPEPVLYYARNQGTIQSPRFVGWFENPFHLSADPSIEVITGAGDVDLDGDLDLVGTLATIPADSVNPVLVRYNFPESDGTPYFGNPVKSPFGLPKGLGREQYALPRLTDIDGDNDLDLFIYRIRDSAWHLAYYEYWHCWGGFSDVQATICEGETYTVGTYALTLPGFYNLHVETPQGCDSTINLLLNVTEAPSRNLSATICAGESYTLGNETFTESGAYMVFLASPDGCDSLVFLNLTVSEEIPVDVTLEGGTLVGHPPGLTYQWIDCGTGQPVNGAIEQSFVPAMSGSYALEVTDEQGCNSTSDCLPVVVTATREPRSTRTLVLYPNPATGYVYLLTPAGEPVSNVRITSITGQMALRVSVEAGNRLDLSGLPPGIYIVQAFLPGGQVAGRLAVH